MSTFSFAGPAVQRLLEHSRAATRRRPTYGQQVDGGYEDEGGAPRADVPPGLWLVKDEGIYLLSNGDRTAEPSDPVYARGYGPDADWSAVQEAAGGDDFVEFLPDTYQDQQIVRFRVSLVQDSLEIRADTIGPELS